MREQFRHAGFQRVKFRTLASDQDAGACRIDRHTDAGPVTLDQNLRNRGIVEILFDVRTNLEIFVKPIAEVVLIVFSRKPMRTPVLVQSQSQPNRINLLTHYQTLPYFSSVRTTVK